MYDSVFVEIAVMCLSCNRLLCTTIWSQYVVNARILIRRFGYLCIYFCLFLSVSSELSIRNFNISTILFRLKIFEEMKKYEVKPNGQTYVCLLNACAAAGQLDPVYVSSLVIQLFPFSFQWLCLLLFTIILSEGMVIVWRFDILYELYVPFQKRRGRKRRVGEGCCGLSWGNKSILLCRSWDRVSGVIFLCQSSCANCWNFDWVLLSSCIVF